MSIFWGHGKNDPLVKYAYAVGSVQFLKDELGIPVTTDASLELYSGQRKGLEFHAYNGLQHSTAPEELEALKRWLKDVISQNP
jgi:predicted esterase